MKEKLKDIGLDFLLFFPRTFGLVKLFKWLFNKKKMFGPKEILINWLMTLSIFALLLVIVYYTSITLKFSVKNKPTLDQKELIDKWGTAIFFLFIITFMIVPFKVYFIKKRKLKDEIKK